MTESMTSAQAQPAKGVLKGLAPATQRVTLGGNARLPIAASLEPVSQEAGRWISNSELKSLLEQARREGAKQAHEDSLSAYQARSEAERAALRLEAETQAMAALEKTFLAQSQEQSARQAERMRSLAKALADQVTQLRAAFEQQVVDWAFASTVRLWGEHAQSLVAPTVRSLLAEGGWDEAWTVLLHADDLALVEQARAQSPEQWPEQLQFKADDRSPLGGCVLQTHQQALDARLEVQLALLREQFDRLRPQVAL